MYLTSLHIQGIKLMRDVEVSFTNPDGSPRMWTVFLGDNGLCKTALLQCIALGAAGCTQANKLAASALIYRDLRSRYQHGEIPRECETQDDEGPSTIKALYKNKSHAKKEPTEHQSYLAIHPDHVAFRDDGLSGKFNA
jgi:hypothetical protein